MQKSRIAKREFIRCNSTSLLSFRNYAYRIHLLGKYLPLTSCWGNFQKTAEWTNQEKLLVIPPNDFSTSWKPTRRTHEKSCRREKYNHLRISKNGWNPRFEKADMLITMDNFNFSELTKMDRIESKLKIVPFVIMIRWSGSTWSIMEDLKVLRKSWIFGKWMFKFTRKSHEW